MKSITRSMTYTIPQLGDNVLKHAKLARICKNVGCAKLVFVSQVYVRSGQSEYSCPVHGKRNLHQMSWMDITGSTMIEFRKIGLRPEPTQLTDVDR